MLAASQADIANGRCDSVLASPIVGGAGLNCQSLTAVVFMSPLLNVRFYMLAIPKTAGDLTLDAWKSLCSRPKVLSSICGWLFMRIENSGAYL